MPNLWSLDNSIVVDFERKVYLDLNYNLKNITLKRFIPMSYSFYSGSWNELLKDGKLCNIKA